VIVGGVRRLTREDEARVSARERDRARKRDRLQNFTWIAIVLPLARALL
jgi:hypothetical protein